MELIMLEQFKSEGARMGFLGLPLEALLIRLRKSIELEYHQVKSSLLNRIDKIRTKLENTDKELNKLASLLNRLTFSINGIAGGLFLILTVAGLIYLWDNILFPGLTMRSFINLGLLIGACSLGGFLLINGNLDPKVKKQLFVVALSICASLITIVATLVSVNPEVVASSITLGVLVGIVVYLINLLMTHMLDSFVLSITYLWLKPKYWLISKVQNYRKAKLSKLSSKLQSIDMLIETKAEIIINEINHEYALGKAATNVQKPITKKVMEEKANVWEKHYPN